MDEFIRCQRDTLDQIRLWPHFRDLIGAADGTYRSVVKAVRQTDVPEIFARIILVCHKSLLSAATLIAQGQPEDSTGITRRALEAARVALAIKINEVNATQWTAYQERHDRWVRRKRNEEPRPFTVRFTDVQGDPCMATIDKHLGVLSDASVHFTPEFYSNLDWEERRTTDGNDEIHLNYLHGNRRRIELELISLASFHLRFSKHSTDVMTENSSTTMIAGPDWQSSRSRVAC
jgi:hypothetical protein